MTGIVSRLGIERRLFGTDGVRGTANMEPVTAETAMKLGRAAAYLFKKHRTGHHRFVIGKDTRLSGYMLESALTAGICSMGVDVLLVGPMPTPAIAFLTKSLRADAGVVISASHNPFEDNGIKFFSHEGFKLPDGVEQEIEELIFSGAIDHERPTAREIGKAFRVDDADGRYIEFAKNTLPKGMQFDGMKIVVDTANGAAYKVAPTVLRELGAEVITIGDRPNGTNINQNCGALFPEALQKAVATHRADIGIAHDGDADRVVFCDGQGKVVHGDQILALCALEMERAGRLAGHTVVATVMSNLGLELALRDAGISLTRTAVGDRYVLERMIKDGCVFGGEQSGHVIFLDFNTTGDGLITALQVLATMERTGKPLSELSACMTVFPQILVNVRVSERRELSDIPGYAQIVSDLERRLGPHGRIFVRYSGTEPLLRVMVEGEDFHVISRVAEELAEALRNSVGAVSSVDP
jgi:phosphoglucosamine mutase